MKNLQDYSSITYRRFLSIEEGNVILNRDIIFYWLNSIKQEKLYSYTKMYMDIFMKNKSKKYLQEYTLFLFNKIKNDKFEKKDICTPVEYYILTCTTMAKNINSIKNWTNRVRCCINYELFRSPSLSNSIPVNTIIKNILFFDYIELYDFSKLLKKDIMFTTSSDMYFLKLECSYSDTDSKDMFYNTLINDLDISNKNKKLLGKDIRDNLDFFFKDPELVNEIGNIFEWDFYIADSNILEDNFIITKYIHKNILKIHDSILYDIYDTSIPYFNCDFFILRDFFAVYLDPFMNDSPIFIHSRHILTKKDIVNIVLESLWKISNYDKNNYEDLLLYYIKFEQEIVIAHLIIIFLLLLNEIIIDKDMVTRLHGNYGNIVEDVLGIPSHYITYSSFRKDLYIALEKLLFMPYASDYITKIKNRYYNKFMPSIDIEDVKNLFLDKFRKIPKIIDLYTIYIQQKYSSALLHSFSSLSKPNAYKVIKECVDNFNIKNVKHIAHFKSIKLLEIASKYNLTHLSYDTLLHINCGYKEGYIGNETLLNSTALKWVISRGNHLSRENIVTVLQNLNLVKDCKNIREALNKINTNKGASEKEKYENDYEEFDFSKNTCIIKDNPITLGNYRMYILKPDDLRLFTIGYDTNCCYHYDGAAEDSLLYSVYMPNSGALVIEDNKKQIKAQAWIWLTKNQKTLVLDNIEFANDQDIDDYIDIIREYVVNSPYNNIHMGMGYNRINTDLFINPGVDKDKEFKNIPRKFGEYNFKKLYDKKIYSDYSKSNYVILKKKGVCFIKDKE